MALYLIKTLRWDIGSTKKHFLQNKTFLCLDTERLVLSKNYEWYSTVTCKVLLNGPHSKLGQYCANSLPNLDEHNPRRCESIALKVTKLCLANKSIKVIIIKIVKNTKTQPN